MDCRETTCCFTGHRPHRLPWREKEWDPRCIRLQERLLHEVTNAYDRGYRHFIFGAARGSDFLFAEAVMLLKKQHSDIILEAAIPCEEQAEGWKAVHQERYHRILESCDLQTMVQQHYTRDCMLRRDYYMVERASLLIAVYDGTPTGGTAKTVLHAVRCGLEIIEIDPNEL